MSPEDDDRVPEEEIKDMWRIFPTDSASSIGLRALWPDGVGESEPPINRLFSAKQHPDIGKRQAAFEREALRLNRLGYNAYVVINPIRADFGGTAATDASIERRRVFLIDIDRAGDTEQPANHAELEACLLLADKVEALLRVRGWGTPYRVMSGNGEHLYYPLGNLPNDKHSTELLRETLLTLASIFDNNAVKIDTCVFNASRITKVPGTIARKGLESEGRPYRMAIVYA